MRQFKEAHLLAAEEFAGGVFHVVDDGPGRRPEVWVGDVPKDVMCAAIAESARKFVLPLDLTCWEPCVRTVYIRKNGEPTISTSARGQDVGLHAQGRLLRCCGGSC